MRLAKGALCAVLSLCSALGVRESAAQTPVGSSGSAAPSGADSTKASSPKPKATAPASDKATGGASVDAKSPAPASAKPSSSAASASATSTTASKPTTPQPSGSQSAKPTQTKPASTTSNGKASNAKSAKPGRANAAKSNNSSSATESRKNGKDSATSDSTQTDPELVALAQAEKALFPWALRGVRSTFSFDEALFGQVSEPAVAPPQWVKDLSLPAVFPNVDGRILTYLDFFRSSPEGKSLLRTWAKKRGRYQVAITATLAKAGVPTELVWQSLVESGHNPSIKSPAGAAGLWQFMPETARLYGLTVDRWLDERLDPERCTMAAAQLMGDLFQHFGNWELALAAYNMGEAGLLRAIRKYNTNDFWALSHYEAGLPMETALYVPRIVALTIVMQNPRVFGIEGIVPDDPVDFDTVTVASGQLLSSVARVIGANVEDLGRLNPHLLAQRIPPAMAADKSPGRIFVPKGTADLVRTRLGRLSGLEADLVAYAVKAGETFEVLANARGVSVDALRNINHATSDERIDSGTVLLLPRQSNEPVESVSADEERIAVIPPNSEAKAGQRRIFYRVRSGDTLTSIADAFGIRRIDLLSHNAIDTSARLQPRMLLQLYVPRDARLDGRSYLDEKDVTLLVAGSPEFSEYFEGLRGNERIVVQVKDKDTLATIGAKYGVSIGMMERINRRSRRDVLIAGDSIVVYTKRKGGPSRVAAAR